MRRLRLRRVLPLSLLAVLVIAAAWVGWQAWQVNRDLTDAVDDVNALRVAAEAGDAPAMEVAVDRLETHSAAAEDRTSGLTWAALTKLPFLGDDARGVRVVSEVVHDLATDGAGPLVDVSQNLEGLVPKSSRVSIDVVRDLEAPVGDANEALAAAQSALSSEDPANFVMRFRLKYRDLVADVSDAHHALSSAATALEVLPTMLGESEERNYLLVFQNNAEVRSTGGLPGAVAVVRTDDGAIELTKQVGANSLGKARQPVLPLSDAESELYGHFVGTYFLNANFTPHFPRIADLMRARWEQVHPEKIDGVISLDTVALSYVLAATGPVTIGDTLLTSENVVDELLHQVYLRYEDPADQDRFFQEVARGTFEQVAGGVGDPESLVRALADGADEGRVYVHSFDDAERAALSGTKVAGESFVEQRNEPRVDVTVNDATGAKMSYFLRYGVRVNPTYCTDGAQGYAGSMRLESMAPDNAATLPDYITGGGLFGADPGTQFVIVRIYSPVGGSISDFTLNAKKLDPDVVKQEGRLVEQVSVQLRPGQVVNLEWRMISGPDQTGDTAVHVTPGVNAGTRSSVAESACG